MLRIRESARSIIHWTYDMALPDADLADAAAESGRTRTELGLYERPEEAGEGEE